MKKKIIILLSLGILGLGVIGCSDEFLAEDDTEILNENSENEADAEEYEELDEEYEEDAEIYEELDEDDEIVVEEDNMEPKDDENDITCPYEMNKQLVFTTEDINGARVSSADFSDKKLIMVNFWEPWCGPCVGEMPELEELYDEYQDKGFVILGVFSTPGFDGEVLDVMDACGVTYPILRYTDSMEPFITEYVPTTIFMDQHGHVLTDEPYIGSNSYDGWKEILEEYLNR